MTDIFDVVADSTRRDILGILLAQSFAANPELSVSDIVTQTGQTQPTVSKHLKVLREAGLVVVREDGQHRFYQLEAAPLAPLAQWVVAFAGEAEQAEPEATGKAPGRPRTAANESEAGESLANDDVRLVAANLGAAAASAIIRTREAWDEVLRQAKDAAERVSGQMRR